MFGICEPIEALNELALKANKGDARSKELLEYIEALEHCRIKVYHSGDDEDDGFCQDRIHASEAF